MMAHFGLDTRNLASVESCLKYAGCGMDVKLKVHRTTKNHYVFTTEAGHPAILFMPRHKGRKGESRDKVWIKALTDCVLNVEQPQSAQDRARNERDMRQG
jgi:hypothetical protein